MVVSVCTLLYCQFGRGRAAIPWAIIKGLEETGVTMFKLDEGVDTGDIIGQGVINLR